MHWVDSTGTLARLKLLNYNTKIICHVEKFMTSQSGEALELKILYEQETAMRAAYSNRDLTVFQSSLIVDQTNFFILCVGGE